MEGLYYNSGQHIFLRINGIYYQRIMAKGWQVIQESDAPNLGDRAKLHEVQREAYWPQLEAQGLV